MTHRLLHTGVLAGRFRPRTDKTPSWRRGAALYGVIFLLAVAFAPHRHFNSLEDLLSDGPSDSGIFVMSPVGAPEGSPSLSSSRLIDDDPCLACFHHDYAASARRLFVLRQTFTPLKEIPALSTLSVAELSFSPLAPPPRVL